MAAKSTKSSAGATRRKATAPKPRAKSVTRKPPSARAHTVEVDVLIAGGGLAGITAAVGLREAGLRVLVVEKTDVLGGRARSWTDAKTGDPVHVGPHIFMSKYPNMFKLMDMLGTRDRITWQEPGRFITMVDGRSEIDVKSDLRLPAPFHFTRSVLADKTMPPADLLSMLPVTAYALQLTEAEIQRLDNINASAFLRCLGVSEYMIQRFWAFACMAIMNVPIELCSAGALLRFYNGLVGIGSMQIGFADTGLSDLFVPQAKAMLAAAGVEIRKNVGVKRLLGDDRRATGAELDDGTIVQARTVISALTPMALRQVLPRAWIRAHKPLHDLVYFQASPYVSTYLWFDRKLTDKMFWARAYDANDLNCDFYDMANINRGWTGRNSVVMTNCIYCERAAHMTDAEIAAETVRELAEYLPEAAEAKLEHYVVNRIPMAIHCPFPGMEQRRPDTQSPIEGLVLAGDWIGTGLPSCMENACYSGWLAAEATMSAHSRPQAGLAIDFGVEQLEGAALAWKRLARLVPLDPISRLIGSRAWRAPRLPAA